MSEQYIYGGTSTLLSGGTDDLVAFGNRITSNNYYQNRWPAAGTITNLRVQLDGGPGGLGKSYIFRPFVNGAVSGTPGNMTVTIAGFATTGIDTANTITLAQGDNFHIRVTVGGAPTQRRCRITYTWTPTNPNYTVVAGITDTSQLPTSGSRYIPMGGACSAAYTTDAAGGLYMPVAGTFRDLFVRIGTAPGAGLRDRKFTLMKNGAATSTVVTIAETSTFGSDTSNTFTVAKGDRVSLRSSITFAGGLPAATYATWGAVFIPDGDDLFLVGMNDTDPVKTGTGTEYHRIASGGGELWVAAATTEQTVSHPVEIIAMQTYMSAVLSSGTWNFDVGHTDGPTTTYVSGSSQVQTGAATKSLVDLSRLQVRCGAISASATIAYLTLCLACRAPQTYTHAPSMF
jgi:hypothetical protein